MDQLYFYVRKMDSIFIRLKDILNDMEDKYKKEKGKNFTSKMMNYYMRTNENAAISNLLEYDEYDIDSDEEESLSEDALEDDLAESNSDDDDDPDSLQHDRCGSIMLRAWEKRSKALRTDIAIAGWMCSPHSEIMYDCNKNHDGEHREAVTRLIRKWFIHEVRNSGEWSSSTFLLTD